MVPMWRESGQLSDPLGRCRQGRRLCASKVHNGRTTLACYTSPVGYARPRAECANGR